MDKDYFEINPVRLAAWSVIAGATVALLVLGKALLVPIAIAVFVWILLSALKATITSLAPRRIPIPGWLANIIAILIVFAATYAAIEIVASQADALTAAVPLYQANFAKIATSVADALDLEEVLTGESLLRYIDPSTTLAWIADSVRSLMSDGLIIAIYVGFLLAEERLLPEKMRRLHRDPNNAERVSGLAAEVSRSIKRYIGMKSVISVLTAALSYAILFFVGVDFAPIWALLIFLLNFIPTIGSIIAVVLPALLTLVQFDTLTPFLIVAIGLGSTQFIIGNVIEPAYMGRSLNLSSFMILLSLSFWGIVWGLAGMFLAVPMMVITGIICAQFRGLRWISVLLSADGKPLADRE